MHIHLISDFLINYQLFITIQNHPQIHLYPQFILRPLNYSIFSNFFQIHQQSINL